MFIYFWESERTRDRERERERERNRAWVREGKREGDRIWSRLQAPSCQHTAQDRAWTHELQDRDLSWNQVPPDWATKAPWKKWLLLKFIYLFWERERDREREEESSEEKGRGRERERDRESQAVSMLSAQSLMWGLIPRTMRSWPDLKARVGRLTDWATQTPLFLLL